MKLFTRISDIISANLHSLLDNAEDPQKVLRLVIRDMDDTLAEARSALANYLSDQKQLQRQLTRSEELCASWVQNAEYALQKNREDLAKSALEEKQGEQERQTKLKQEMEVVAESINQLRSDIEKLQLKISDAKQREKAFLVRQNAASTRLTVQRRLHETHIDEAISRFEQYERRVDEIEADIEAYEMTAKKDSLADEFAVLRREQQIETELAELKARVA
jgi:phage shock protein A